MRMIHVTIQTNKFEEEINFYKDHVGLTIQRDLREKGREIVFLGNGEGETLVEVVNKPDADNAGNSNISIGFECEDLQAKRESIIEAGLTPTPVIKPMPGVEFFFVTDPAGVNVQFM